MRFPAAALIALCLATLAVAGDDSPIRAGAPYLEARMLLLESGFKAGPIPPSAGDCAMGFEDICQGYKETVGCRGSGLAGCEFLFWKGRRPFLVVTKGEELSDQKVKSARFLRGSELKKSDTE